MKFEFATATRIVFGPGSIRQASQIISEFGRQAMVVTGRDSSRAGKFLNGIPFAVTGEPDLKTVRDGVAFAKEKKCDVIVGMGGGSALDSAKAIAAMLSNEGDVLDYLEVIGAGKTLTRPSAPFIAIPTTSGTGSEVTRNAVLASPQHRVKVSLRSPLMLAKVAIVDPELTWDVPPPVTASTGLDALTQVIEPYVSCRANPMTDGLCVEGIQRAARSLRPAFANSRDAAAREEMAVASLFGGLALANAGLGAVHGFAGVIGGMYPAPHGAICAALLPHVMKANLAALRARDAANPSLPRFTEVAQLLTGETAAADEGVEWIFRLVEDLKIPKLGSYGIKPEHVAEVVAKSKNASSMKANPLALTDEELALILSAAL